MKSTFSTLVVVVGAVLLTASFIWGLIFPANVGWTEEKGERMAELTQQAHTLMFEVKASQESPSMHSGRNPAETKAEYDRVKAELETLRAEFEGKRDSPKTAATFLRWSGIAFVVAGAIVVFAGRNA
jgi:hypothetical protein